MTSGVPPTLSVVVPVFNEDGSLDELHRRVTAALAGVDHELVFVDDGSTDASWARLLALAAADRNVRLVRLSRNFGHQPALTAGIDAARGQAVVLMDADLQDPPEAIPALVARWRDGYDVVYVVRSERDGETRFKRATAWLFYRILHAAAPTEIPVNAGDFRLLSRRAVDALARMPERARFLRGMTSWVGYRQIGVTYRREARFAGTTKYPARKMLRFALDALTSFSTAPIRLVTMLGFVTVLFCAGYLGYTLYERLFTSSTVAGWTSVVTVILLLGGVQLLALGMIGQYIARIFEETKGRPLYLIDEIVETALPAAADPAATTAPAP